MKAFLFLALTIVLLFGVVVCKEVLGFRKLPVDWILSNDKLSPSKEISIKIALSSKGKSALERTILEVSSPSSKSFRKYLSQSEIANIVGLSDEEIKKVSNW